MNRLVSSRLLACLFMVAISGCTTTKTRYFRPKNAQGQECVYLAEQVMDSCVNDFREQKRDCRTENNAREVVRHNQRRNEQEWENLKKQQTWHDQIHHQSDRLPPRRAAIRMKDCEHIFLNGAVECEDQFNQRFTEICGGKIRKEKY